MQKVAIEDVETVPHFMGVNSHRKPLARAIDDLGFAAVYFELDPGEAFSGGLHTHEDQEELFVVLEGTATFETRAEPGGETTLLRVGPREVVHFAEDDVFQQGRNESDGPVVGLALGVPGRRHEWDGVKSLVDCPACGEETVHSVRPAGDDEPMPDAERMVVTCRACGNEL